MGIPTILLKRVLERDGFPRPPRQVKPGKTPLLPIPAAWR